MPNCPLITRLRAELDYATTALAEARESIAFIDTRHVSPGDLACRAEHLLRWEVQHQLLARIVSQHDAGEVPPLVQTRLDNPAFHGQEAMAV
jgi:hypothetical protein